MNLRLRILAGLLVAGTTSPALADGGYWAGNQGSHAAGRGGAFAVKADDIMAVMYNPAGLARQPGTRIQLGNRFSYNVMSYERQPTLDWGNGSLPPYVEFERVENDKTFQPIDPLFGVSSDLGVKGLGLALVAYAPAGVSQMQFPLDGGQRYMMVSRKGESLHYNLSAAYNYDNFMGFGASLQYIYLRTLEYDMVIDGNLYPETVNPVSAEYDIQSHIEGSDPATFNAILGAWVRAAPFLEFGVSGQVIPTAWVVEGKLESTLLSTGAPIELVRRDPISDVETPANDVTLKLPLPMTARAGVRYIHENQGQEIFDVELDVVYETWSRVDKFTVDSRSMIAKFSGEEIDIGTIEIEKNWQDTIGVHLGGDFALSPDLLTVRAGGYYETAVAKPEYAHVDFASGAQVGGGLGGSLKLGALEVSLAYAHRRQLTQETTEAEGKVYQTVPGSLCTAPYDASVLVEDGNVQACHPEYYGQPAPTVNGGKYHAFSHTLALDVMYQF